MCNNEKLTVTVATPLTAAHAQLLTELEPRIELLYEPELLPPMRWVGDHDGDPSFTRTPAQEQRFQKLLSAGEAYYGIPDTKPTLLAEMVRSNPKLRWVHTMAAGGGAQVKAAGLSEAELGRVKWSTSAGPHAEQIAHWVAFAALAGVKDLPKLQAQQADHYWSGRWVMRDVADCKAVIVGLGAIGQSCADYLSRLGFKVSAVNRSVKSCAHVSEVFPVSQLAEAVSGADVLVNALPGTANTQGLIAEDILSALAPGATVVSVGRGNAIDEAALIRLLESSHIGFAGLDVFAVEPLAADSPLWDMRNVLIAPHTIALSAKEDERIARLFAANATKLLNGETLVNEMNTVEFY